MVPDASWPCVTTGSWAGKVPLIRLRSEWQIPQNATLTRTSPGPGSGIGTSSTAIVFGISVEPLRPHRVNHVAPSSPAGPRFMALLPSWRSRWWSSNHVRYPSLRRLPSTAPSRCRCPRCSSRWYGPIPPIKAVVDQAGDWDAVGKTRTVVLTGGGSMREQLTSYDPPRSFGYTLSDVKGPMAPMVARVEGLWSFEPVGTGTKVTWRWTIYPRSAFTARGVAGVRQAMAGYARQSLEELSNQLVR